MSKKLTMPDPWTTFRDDFGDHDQHWSAIDLKVLLFKAVPDTADTGEFLIFGSLAADGNRVFVGWQRGAAQPTGSNQNSGNKTAYENLHV